MDVTVVTCSAPVNIAVIKYWGKREETLILPTNSSLSVTLDQNELSATTSIALSEVFSEDRIWLNGREESMDNPRLVRCLREARKICSEQNSSSAETHKGCVHICSVNNFPTAAGLASSAAGYACLVFGLSKLYDIKGDISRIARQGSGSASRSVYGGFVKWERGEREDGHDSIAVQVAPASHWPEVEVLVLVVSGKKKAVSSSSGMQTSTRTSSLMSARIETVVPRRMLEMEEAIAQRDFQSFGKLTMQDSNQFHAICLDTYPPIMYLNDASKRIIEIITSYNKAKGEIRAAYTFDAGPNAVLYVLSPDVPEVLDLITHHFPPPPSPLGEEGEGEGEGETSSLTYIQGLSKDYEPRPIDKTLLDKMMVVCDATSPGLQYIIHTKVGGGPCLLDSSTNSLLDSNGLPVKGEKHES